MKLCGIVFDLNFEDCLGRSLYRINFRFRGDLLQINIERALCWGDDLFYE